MNEPRSGRGNEAVKRNLFPLCLLTSAATRSRWVAVILGFGSAFAAEYFPPRGEWQKKSPTELGLDAAKLEAAVAYAVANEYNTAKDVAEDLRSSFGKR